MVRKRFRYTGVPQFSSYAVSSFVLGILGFFLLPLVGSFLAIVFAARAEKEIRRSGGALTGEGFAQAGRILGLIGMLLMLLVVLILVLRILGPAARSATPPPTTIPGRVIGPP